MRWEAAQSCTLCAEMSPSNPSEPFHTNEEASRPFEQIHADFATVRGRNFLVLVDQFSGWPHVTPFSNTATSARQLIDAVRLFFINGAGVPVKFWSDNGPQFAAAEFKSFLADWGIERGTSSPHYPQSNGYAEAAVKSMKKLVIGCWKSGSFDNDGFSKALLLCRNTSRSGGSASSSAESRP